MGYFRNAGVSGKHMPLTSRKAPTEAAMPTRPPHPRRAERERELEEALEKARGHRAFSGIVGLKRQPCPSHLPRVRQSGTGVRSSACGRPGSVRRCHVQEIQSPEDPKPGAGVPGPAQLLGCTECRIWGSAARQLAHSHLSLTLLSVSPSLFPSCSLSLGHCLSLPSPPSLTTSAPLHLTPLYLTPLHLTD